MKQILITGGAGFIGSHLCARLLEEGNEVICLDNYFTGSKENVIPLLKNPHFELIRHDVSIPFQAEVDEIYNLACPASPVYYQIDPIQTIKTSVLGAVNMLGLAKRVNAKILQASTSEVAESEASDRESQLTASQHATVVVGCYFEVVELLPIDK